MLGCWPTKASCASAAALRLNADCHLERERLIEIRPGDSDGRSKELHLTEAAARLRSAVEGW
jgi:hypothetical protein